MERFSQCVEQQLVAPTAYINLKSAYLLNTSCHLESSSSFIECWLMLACSCWPVRIRAVLGCFNSEAVSEIT